MRAGLGAGGGRAQGVRLLIQSGDLTFSRGGKGCREWFFLPRFWLSKFFVFTCQHPGVGGDRCLQWWESCAQRDLREGRPEQGVGG